MYLKNYFMDEDVYSFALYFAKKAHERQTDKGGNDYFIHVTNVAFNWNLTHFQKTVAILHDVLEDTWVTERILRHLFPEGICNSVVTLTRKGSESYDDYIERIATSGNIDAMVVKIADLNDNMNLGRLNEVTEKDLERVKKYARAKKRLEEVMEKERMAF